MPADVHLFHRLRWNLFHNSLFLLWRRSLVRVLTIFFCSALIWAGLFTVSWFGFHELSVVRKIPLDGGFLEGIFAIFFFVLTVFLFFSTAIILYSSLFTSPESAFLLGSPVPEDRIFAYKLQSAVAFSSWAFVLLGSPILLAYGLAVPNGAPWHFYPVLVLFLIGYVFIPGSLGAAIVLLLVNFAPRRRKQVVVPTLAGLVLAGVFRFVVWLRDLRQNLFGSRDWFDSLIGELDSFRGLLLPYHWLARGLVGTARGELDALLYNLALIWSNGLVLFLLVAWLAKKSFRRGFNLVATGGDLRRRYGGAWLDRAANQFLFFLHPQTRLLIIKDFRTFRRDPAQLWQIVILLGLAFLYFLQMRWAYRQDIGREFQNGVSLLTLTAASFWLCAYTGRFIFPLLSLEGRRFWILGLLPLDRDRLLWGKFAFSATGCLLLSVGLVVCSDLLLHMPWLIVVIHGLTVAVLSLGLSGLSVGLGACLPNFRETDPSKIAVGFGGTLNLVAGLLFLLTVIALMAGPAHVWLHSQHLSGLADVPWWIWIGLLLGLVLGAAGVVLPLRAGARNLRRMEF